MSQEYKLESFDKGMLVTRIIWAAIFGSVFIYVLICHMVAVSNSINMPSSPASPRNLAQFLPQYTAVMLISCALSEAVGIFGLVLFLAGDSFQNLYIFIGVSAIALVYFRSKKEEIEKMANAVLDVRAISPEN